MSPLFILALAFAAIIVGGTSLAYLYDRLEQTWQAREKQKGYTELCADGTRSTTANWI